jgi:pimeloyl-ACP methyl ester carboxylesterase
MVLAMRSLLCVIVLAACGNASAPPTAAPAAAPVTVLAPKSPDPATFQPTAFTVDVRGTGRPVILIPGLGCPGSVWDETVAHLHAQTHVLTLAGFAGVPPVAGDMLEATRTQLVQYIRDRKLDHPVIIGHSLGGFVAMWLAAEHPDLVGPLVIVDAGPSLLAKNSSPAAADAIRDEFMKQTDETWAQNTRQMFTMMGKDQKRLAPVIDAVVRSDRRTFAEAFRTLFLTDLAPQLAKITAPTLALLSDSPYADELQKEFAGIAQHEIHVLSGTRHFVFLDDPTAFYAALDKFLAAHP